MNVKMTIEKNLRGFTEITLVTPAGSTFRVNPLIKDKTRLKKFLYKITCEYLEDEKNEKARKTK